MKNTGKILYFVITAFIFMVFAIGCSHRKSGDYSLIEDAYLDALHPLLDSASGVSEEDLCLELLALSRRYEDILLHVYDETGLVFWSDGYIQDTDESAKHQIGRYVVSLSPKVHDLPTTGETSKHGMSGYKQMLLIALLVVAIYVLSLIVAVVYNKGLKNMRLYTKVQYLVLGFVLAAFVYIILLSISYMREHYEVRQQESRRKTAHYIQAALQQAYFWDIALSQFNSEGLSTDLRDLSYTYSTDIVVYGLDGHLIASSVSPARESVLVAPLMAPEAFFNHRSQGVNRVQYERVGNLHYLTAYTEMLNGSMIPIGYIAVPSYVSSAEVDEELADYIGRLLPPYVVLLLLALVLAVVAANRMTHNLRHLSDTMERFALGKDNHIRYSGNDEIGELVTRYNEMVDQMEESTRKLAQAEREGAWRTMARQVAHEINNTLTPMKLSIQQLQRIKGTERFDERFDKASAILLDQFDDLGRIASSFSDFAKMPEVHPSVVDIADKLYQSVVLMRANAGNIPIRYVGQQQGVMAYADAEQVQHVFTNVLKNAIQALEDVPNGDIIVILKSHKDEVEISISDNGPGIAEEQQSKIFMPNFTTKSTGAGLGLAIAKNIVEGSEGRISFESSDTNTTFYIYFKKN